MTDLSTFLLCVTLAALWWRAEPRMDRVLSAYVSRITLHASEGTPEIPIDIAQTAQTWQDAHARESYVARAREIYSESQGTPTERWDRVRVVLSMEVNS